MNAIISRATLNIAPRVHPVSRQRVRADSVDLLLGLESVLSSLAPAVTLLHQRLYPLADWEKV